MSVTSAQRIHSTYDEARVINRLLIIVGLNALVLVHILDLPSKLQEAPYLAVGYLGLISLALLLMQQLMRRDSPLLYITAGLLGTGVAIAFITTRTVGLPMAMDDIGNWTEPLGLASLIIDVYLVVQAVLALMPLRNQDPFGRARSAITNR